MQLTHMKSPYKRKIRKRLSNLSMVPRKERYKSEIYIYFKDSLDYEYAYEKAYGEDHLNGNGSEASVWGLRMKRSGNLLLDWSIVVENTNHFLKRTVSVPISLLEPLKYAQIVRMGRPFERKYEDKYRIYCWYGGLEHGFESLVFLSMTILNRLRPPGPYDSGKRTLSSLLCLRVTR